ncbi:MAG: UPF0182 family protein [Microcoleaceae cyanobacterium]
MKIKNSIIIAIIVIILLVVSLSQTLVHLLTEAWWFNAVNFANVFWTRISWQICLGVGTFIIYALFLCGNYWIAEKLTSERSFRFLEGTELAPYSNTFAKVIAGLTIVLISLSAAAATSPAWETFLKFLKATDFQLQDPIYQRDIGFYLFTLPLYEGIKNWLLTLLFCGLVIAVVVYALKGKFTNQRQWQNFLTGSIKTHISILLAGMAILVAVGFWLERYELLFDSNGVVFGAGYTDVNAKLFAYWVMTIVALLLAIVCVFSVWKNNALWPTYGIVIYIVTFGLFNVLYPGFQQKFIVNPNELEKERPYIANNIKFTRNAYGLNDVEIKSFPAKSELDSQTLENNQATVRNIRLWDYRPLLSTYRQLQEIRLYYRFNDVDVDRYTLDGNYRQVMLSPREMVYAQVPKKAQTWVNEHLKYTHGYGLVMNPVNEVTPDGLPILFIKDIPPVSQVNLQVEEPAIYYGEKTDTYIFTGMDTEEFDYPRSGENAFTTYSGKGGVPINSLWRRLVYAYDLSSINILISGYFTDNSKIHYYRNIKQRVNQVAPFLRFDNDPYVALIDGKMQWILEAYTVSDRYPYSEPVAQSNNAEAILNKGNVERIARGNINYIRNSVKVTIDAYDGTMKFFVVDENDPVLKTYQKIFPQLFTEKSAIPANVKAHFRYPLDLFKIQAQMYLSYHMNEPQLFYNQEDLWRFPTEVYEGNKQLMEPYYLIMRLPEKEGEEFVLILPFTPVNKDNMIAWMAAQSDGGNYGKLLLYEFPKQKLVYGPSQIEARIDQNPKISQQLTLWSQKGSKVIRGDLLVIPIEESLMYVEPVYLRAEQGELPELKRVIVAYDKEVIMEETLNQSLAAIFGGKSEKQQIQVTEAPSESETEKSSNLINRIVEAYRQTEAARRQDNWVEYGKFKQEFEQLLQQLEKQTKNGVAE